MNELDRWQLVFGKLTDHNRVVWISSIMLTVSATLISSWSVEIWHQLPDYINTLSAVSGNSEPSPMEQLVNSIERCWCKLHGISRPISAESAAVCAKNVQWKHKHSAASTCDFSTDFYTWLVSEGFGHSVHDASPSYRDIFLKRKSRKEWQDCE